MASKNIKPLDVLRQVRKEADAILSDLESINQDQNLQLENFLADEEFQAILREVGQQNTAISQHLAEINERAQAKFSKS